MKTVTILGVKFYDGTSVEALEGLSYGGLAVFPSGPGLALDLLNKPAYKRAIVSADFVFPDSGLMVFLWNLIMSRRKIRRYSGLKFLRDIFDSRAANGDGVSFWVMPSRVEMDSNLVWLERNGFPFLSEQDCYIAPHYRTDDQADGSVRDDSLRDLLERKRPSYIFLNVGGGVQEQLGWFLRENLSYRPAILCTGAAVAFLTGGQASIPPWADRFYLGWLLRIMGDPTRFGRRYLEAWRLVPLLLKYRDKPVP